ncbi:MAG: M56 family metallopeptidase [Vicinamibacterales bacterium]
MTIWLWNLAAYSAQLAALVVTAAAVASLFRLNAPRVAVRFWQVVMAVALALPLLQPRTGDPGATIGSSLTFISTAAGTGAAASSRFDPATLIGGVLLAGVAGRLVWLGMGLWRLRSIRRRAVPAPSLDGVSLDLAGGLQTTAAVMLSDEVEGPATVGWWRAVVLLPRGILHQPPAVQKAVLCHELMHVRRRDWLATVLEEAWCAVLWFHPGARLLASRACLARETLVDEETILHTRDRRAYAEALLAFSAPQPHLVGATALIGRRHLSQRISLIAQEVSMSRNRAASLLALSAAIVAVATVSAASSFPMLSTEAQSQQVHKPGPGVTLPVVVHEVKPSYTREAMNQKIQGSVMLGIVVLADGRVGDIIVEQSLDQDYGLDQEAIKAARQWIFKPGSKDGKPVPVRVMLQLTFTLK